jgi:hypothetical protein
VRWIGPLLAGVLSVAPASAAQPLPDPELLLFLAEFADEQGELADPALLQHAQAELENGAAGNASASRSGRHAGAVDSGVQVHASDDEAPTDAAAASGNSSRARRAENHDD